LIFGANVRSVHESAKTKKSHAKTHHTKNNNNKGFIYPVSSSSPLLPLTALVFLIMLLMVGISVGIAGVALHILWDRYDAFVLYFFEDLILQEQVAVMALFFAMMLASVGILHTLLDDTSSNVAFVPNLPSPTNNNSSNSNNKSHVKSAYPLHEMNQALSDRSKFECLYPWLRDSILDHMRQDHQVAADEQVLAYLTKMMNYTIMGGKFNRGTTVLSVFKAIRGSTAAARANPHCHPLKWHKPLHLDGLLNCYKHSF
jgi:hypothetical protein